VLKSQHMLEKGSGSMRKGGIQKYISLMRNLNSPPSHQKCRLHPLIHTLLGFSLAQNMYLCRCEEKESPHWPTFSKANGG